MKRLTPTQIKQLQQKFLNKNISVPFINKTGYGSKNNEETIEGYCTYLNYNPFFPSWGLQITINRTPISNIDHTKIKLKIK